MPILQGNFIYIFFRISVVFFEKCVCSYSFIFIMLILNSKRARFKIGMGQFAETKGENDLMKKSIMDDRKYYLQVLDFYKRFCLIFIIELENFYLNYSFIFIINFNDHILIFFRL